MKRKNKKVVNSKKYIVDGIEFKSGLEVYMYKKLKENDIFAEYEKMKFEIMPSFDFPCSSYERKGKGDFKEQGNKKVRGISYTPDFVGDKFVIETKGRANERFPIVWKLFKKLMVELENDVDLYKPQNQKDCDEVVKLILNRM
jgi:hypothetical protein